MKTRILPLLVYAVAGPAGWGAAAWWKTLNSPPDRMQSAVSPPPRAVTMESSPAAAAALTAITRPREGSTELSRIAAFAAAAPDFNAARRHVEGWPPGAAREFALAVLHERTVPEEPDPPFPLTAEPVPHNRFLELESTLVAGETITGRAYPNIDPVEEWVSSDPAAATAAILKMPDNRNRSEAVETAAAVLTEADPAAALEFVTQSGESRPGKAAARAWSKLITNPSPGNKGGTAPARDLQRQLLGRMSPQQQDSLFSGLAKLLDDQERGYVSNDCDAIYKADAALIARCVLQAERTGPGLEHFFASLTEFNPVAGDETIQFIESCAILSPAHTRALEILLAARVTSSVRKGNAAVAVRDIFNDPASHVDRPALLNRTATALLPGLVRSGESAAAVQLLGQISDTAIRHRAFEAMLPAWMETNPSEARAAFEAAPLTGLERERWERHPAFLLHRGQ